MATMGLGGVGALAAKALGVSMMALMLAGIVGLKKLADGGGDGGHSVHYVRTNIYSWLFALNATNIYSDEKRRKQNVEWKWKSHKKPFTSLSELVDLKYEINNVY